MRRDGTLSDPRAAALVAIWLLAGGLTGTTLAQPGPAQPGQGAPPERIELAPRPPRSGGPTGNDVVQQGSGVARGVVHPPSGVDPGVHAPAPDPTPNTTPVIPPPGTPGGDPRVQPR
jgi:hypothetical protein